MSLGWKIIKTGMKGQRNYASSGWQPSWFYFRALETLCRLHSLRSSSKCELLCSASPNVVENLHLKTKRFTDQRGAIWPLLHFTEPLNCSPPTVTTKCVYAWVSERATPESGGIRWNQLPSWPGWWSGLSWPGRLMR